MACKVVETLNNDDNGPVSSPYSVASGQLGSRYLIAPSVLRRLLASDKRRFLQKIWTEAKMAAFPQVRIEDLPGVSETLIKGWPTRLDAQIVAALAVKLECRTFFEFGTFRGRTTWTVVHNNPSIRAFTLDLPGPKSVNEAVFEVTDPYLFDQWGRGDAIGGTPEAARITLLNGDSAQFNYVPYQNEMDLIYIDGSHSYGYVRSDTEAALGLLSPTGTIIWDDPYYTGVWKYLQEKRSSLSMRLVAQTGMVIHSRHPAMAGVMGGS